MTTNRRLLSGRVVAAALALLLLSACSVIDPGQLLSPASPTVPSGPTAPPEATLPAAPPATVPLPGGETPVLMCTPPACAPGEVYACGSGDGCPGGCGTICAAPTAAPGRPATGPLAPAPADWESLETWLTDLWRNNVNPAAVRAALQQSGVQRSDADWRAADLNGDLLDEWIAVLYDPSLPGVPFGAAGDLWVINGDGVVFRYYAAPSSDIYSFLAPAIIAIADVTGDRRPEIITDAPFCGAHTCTSNYRVIGQTAAGLADLVQRAPLADDDPGTTIAMPTADIQVTDTNGDGTADLVVHGGAIGSAGAGTVRTRSEVWRWDGAAETLAETRLDPTNLRHLLLYEANDRMAAGDLDGALGLYELVINEPTLVTASFLHTPEQVTADIHRFAAFRLILIDLLQGDVTRAAGRLEWLQANHPDAPATAAAVALLGGWTGAGGQAALCATIESEMAALDNPTGTLSDMGYGNPSLGAADFCPFVSDSLKE